MITLKEKQQAIFPVRIMKTYGKVEGEQNLLKERQLALLPTWNRADVVRLTKDSGNNPFLLLDFGKELQGGVRLVTVAATPLNIKIRLVFGESVTESLSYIGYMGATNNHSPRDIIVDIANLSVLDFGKTGFRFVKVELVEEGSVFFKNIVAISRTADIEKKGYIKTDDELFNKILDSAEYTCFLNIQDGVFWDGIKRDRLVWSGDLNSEILTTGYLYGTIQNMKNCIELLRKDTPKDVWMNNIPSYSVWWVLNLVDYYMLSGDREFFENNCNYLNYILGELDACILEDEVNFEKTGKKTTRPYFLDWPTSALPDDAFVGTMMLILYTMRKLQKLSDVTFDRSIAKNIEKKVEKYQLYPTKSKESLAMQICCGGKDTKNVLESNGANGFSTFMCYFLLKGLDFNGSKRTIDIAKEYYGGMLSRGATTFWEDFDIKWLEGSGRIDEETPSGLKDLHADYGNYCYKGLRHSLCHGWSSGVVGFFVENVLGLEVVSPGFKKVRILPKKIFGYAEGSIPTPYGNIFIQINANGETVVKLPDEIERVE